MDNLKSFYKKLFFILIVVVAILIVFPYTRDSTLHILGFSVLLVIGMFLGPYLFYAYPINSNADIVVYSVILFCSIFLTYVGFKNRAKKYAHIIFWIGLIIWAILGLMAMGEHY